MATTQPSFSSPWIVNSWQVLFRIWGANHTSDYDLRYNEENKDGLKVSLESFGVVENAIAKVLLVGFRFHTLNDALTLMGNLPYLIDIGLIEKNDQPYILSLSKNLFQIFLRR